MIGCSVKRISNWMRQYNISTFLHYIQMYLTRCSPKLLINSVLKLKH